MKKNSVKIFVVGIFLFILNACNVPNTNNTKTESNTGSTVESKSKLDMGELPEDVNTAFWKDNPGATKIIWTYYENDEKGIPTDKGKLYTVVFLDKKTQSKSIYNQAGILIKKLTR